MKPKPDDNYSFQSVRDIVEKDFDLLIELRHIEEQASLFHSPERVQAVRRLYVRMLVTLVESAVAVLKQESLEKPSEFSEGELALLREVRYEISSKGQMIEKDYYSGFESSFRFAFSMYAKAHEFKFQPDYSNNGREALKATV